MVNVGDDPARLASAAAFMHTMVQSVARQGHRFANVDPEILTAAAAGERTATGPQVDHRLTVDAKVASYSVGLQQAYQTAKFGEDPLVGPTGLSDRKLAMRGEWRRIPILRW